jgi:poly(3-hydroxybutyrate) depolymerase
VKGEGTDVSAIELDRGDLDVSASSDATVRRSGGATSWILRASGGAIGLHAANAWVLQPDGGPGLTTRILRLGMLLLAAAALLRLWRTSGAAGRGTIALLLGSAALVAATAITLLHIRKTGLARSHYTGVLSMVGGLVFFGAGAGMLTRLARSVWRRVLAVVGFLALLVYVLAPVTFAVYATNAPRMPLGSRTPAQWGLAYEEVRMSTEGGLRLAGWYVPSANGAAVILLHGAGSTRASTLDHAALLARQGFGVLMFDARGHGESEGTVMEWGWHGARDVRAAVDHLLSRPEITAGRIGALGLSMGGQQAITAAALDPRIRAVVSDGAIAQAFEDAHRMVGWLVRPFYRVMFAAGDLLTGASPPPSLVGAVPTVDRPLLLIAGDESREVQANRLYASLGGATTSLWMLPDTPHTQAIRTHPGEYERRVVEFFASALSTG